VVRPADQTHALAAGIEPRRHPGYETDAPVRVRVICEQLLVFDFGERARECLPGPRQKIFEICSYPFQTTLHRRSSYEAGSSVVRPCFRRPP